MPPVDRENSFHSLKSKQLLSSLPLLLMSACMSDSAATLDGLGIKLTPYLDFKPLANRSDSFITDENQGRFSIEGQCGEEGGRVELIAPESLRTETLCTSDGRWTLTLDLTTFPDDVYQFTIRHFRVDEAKYFSVNSENYFKITRVPTPLEGIPSSAGINTAVNGSTMMISWATGYDSSGTPLAEYEVSVSSGSLGGGTVYQDWTSVGASTSTQVSVPSGSTADGSVFYVNIRGKDQVGQTTAPGSTQYEVDSVPPTFSTPISPSSSVVASSTSGPSFTWVTTDGSGSGIERIEYRIALVSTGALVLNWTALASTATGVTPTGLSLTPGSLYRIDVRAIDKAGNDSSNQTAQWSVAQPTLVVGTLPSSATVGQALSISVSLQDGQGNTLTTAQSAVTLAAFSDNQCAVPASGTLGGTTNLAPSNGVASFSGLTFDTETTLYLRASATGFPSTCSSGGISITATTNRPVVAVADVPYLWLKADGITGVANGATVSTWSDSSGNGNDFNTHSVYGNPTYTSSALTSGKPALRFQGSQCLKFHNTNADPITGNTTFLVFSYDNVSVNQTLLATSTSDGSLDPSWLTVSNWIYGDSTFRGVYTGYNNATLYNRIKTTTNPFTSANRFYILTLRRASGSGTTDVYVDGLARSTATVANQLTNPNGKVTTLSIGCLGNYGGGNLYNLKGYLSEMITYQSPLTDSARGKVESYLGSKYGIILPLVASAPNSTLSLGGTRSITVSGGVAPYVFNVTSGGGSVNSSGLYTAPSSGYGSGVITITDSSSPALSTTVTVPYQDPSAPVYASCTEAYLAGVTSSGMVSIDFDGSLGARPMRQFYCEMSDPSNIKLYLKQQTDTLQNLRDIAASEPGTSGITWLDRNPGSTTKEMGWYVNTPVGSGNVFDIRSIDLQGLPPFKNVQIGATSNTNQSGMGRLIVTNGAGTTCYEIYDSWTGDGMMRLIVDTVILQYSTTQQTGTLRTATTCNGNRLNIGFGRNVQYSTMSYFYLRELILTEQ